MCVCAQPLFRFPHLVDQPTMPPRPARDAPPTPGLIASALSFVSREIESFYTAATGGDLEKVSLRVSSVGGGLEAPSAGAGVECVGGAAFADALYSWGGCSYRRRGSSLRRRRRALRLMRRRRSARRGRTERSARRGGSARGSGVRSRIGRGRGGACERKGRERGVCGS